ncbi:MAG TPA: type II secretion system F family protein [Anaerolineales bacterium]|nr:type II secretion system F family protein [Anaerolineales bacterium]
MDPTFIIVILVVLVLGAAGALIVIGLRDSSGDDPLQDRLAEFAERGEAASLHDIEMSQSLTDRIIIPMANRIGEIALKITPQKALDEIQRKLEMAGNPKGLEPTTFFASRFILAVVFGALMIFVFGAELFTLTNFLITVGATVFGFIMPNLLITSMINRRQDEVRKALPDALDLLTICVEAGLGFDAAMRKVADKWDNQLSIAFGRALQEMQLGKLRREALRDMADRIGASEFESFIAAVIQSEQLGVSMAKILRIQSDDMRVKRRQRAEQQAQKAPVLMLLPMAFLIFPTIMIVMMGPAVLIVMNGPISTIFGG